MNIMMKEFTTVRVGDTWLSGLKKKIYDFSIPEVVHLREERYSWIFGNRNMSAHWQSLET